MAYLWVRHSRIIEQTVIKLGDNSREYIVHVTMEYSEIRRMFVYCVQYVATIYPVETGTQGKGGTGYKNLINIVLASKYTCNACWVTAEI